MILSSFSKDIIAILIIIVIIGGALFYIIKAKKNGAKCIGCPQIKTCSSCDKNKCSKCDMIRNIKIKDEE